MRLAGARNLIADQVRAAVVLPGRSTREPRQLWAQSVSKGGDDLILSFPSPAAWKLFAEKGGKPAIPEDNKIEVSVSLPGHTMIDGECVQAQSHSARCESRYGVAYMAKAKTPDPGFSTVATVRTVAIGEKGVGSFRFALNLRGAKKVLLRGDGVVVNKVDPALPLANDYAWQLATSGLITVTLDQLTPGQQFKLVLTGTEDRTQEIPIEAKNLAAEEKKSDGAK